jgi:hypothetical protein
MKKVVDKVFGWIEEMGIEDSSLIPYIIQRMRKCLETICEKKAMNGDNEAVLYFTPWSIRSSLRICEISASTNNIDLCRILSTSRERMNIMAIIAARKGYTDIVRHMVEKGCDMISMVADAACENGYADIVSLVLSHGHDDKVRMMAIAEKNKHHHIVTMIQQHR